MPQPLPTPDSRGKVRDLYDLGDRLLLVASDRLSAFDVVLPDPIPYKGEVLTKLSLFWFELLGDVVPNHLLSADVADLPEQFAPMADYLRGRFMLVKKATGLPGRVHRARLPRGKRLGRVPARRDRVRHPARRGAGRVRPPARADLHALDQGRDRPARRERQLRAHGRDHRRRAGRGAAGQVARGLLGGARACGVAGHHHRRHQVRVRHDRRAGHAGRRGAHAGFEPVLAGGELSARQRPAELRQAVRPRLARSRAAGTRTRQHPRFPPRSSSGHPRCTFRRTS